MVTALIGDSFYSVKTTRSAEIIDERLAQQGLTVICVGLTGIMEAVRLGAKLGRK